jgi:phytoene desaturase
MSEKVIVIGAGFAGLSASSHLAKKGFDVVLLEKHALPGGRARRFSEKGFTFDMGPSWYWMPDVFDGYFNNFGKKVADYYTLKRLDPSYKVVFSADDQVDIPAGAAAVEALFEKYEPGSGIKLRKFLAQAAYKYDKGINDLVHRPSLSVTEFMDPRLLFDMLRMDIFKSFSAHIKKYFKHPYLLQLLEFPILFLGATPENTPALYSLMNYADIVGGTWYPEGGMYKIVEGMARLAEELGVRFLPEQNVKEIVVHKGKVTEVHTAGATYTADAVVAAADYHHVEQQLLPPENRSYTDKYWQKRTMAPSSLLFYLGLDTRLKNASHHTLYFDAPFGPHADAIYENPRWPENPLFYASAPSVTDPTVAPAGHENLFLLMPLAPGLTDAPEQREKYFDIMIKRLCHFAGQDIANNIVYKRSYAMNDFKNDYNAWQGNAYGLANTLLQTALLKPRMHHKKVKNLWYAGQLTVPGPGVPPSLISGQVAAQQVQQYFSKNSR